MFNTTRKKIRLVNVYAPATRDKLNSFYTDLEAYLLTNRQLILGGDFNCVLDSARDTRSTCPPPSTLWCTKALRALVTARGWPTRGPCGAALTTFLHGNAVLRVPASIGFTYRTRSSPSYISVKFSILQ